MKKHLITSLLMTLVTTLLLGILYPLAVTALAQLFFRDKANGQLIVRSGQLVVAHYWSTLHRPRIFSFTAIRRWRCRL